MTHHTLFSCDTHSHTKKKKQDLSALTTAVKADIAAKCSMLGVGVPVMQAALDAKKNGDAARAVSGRVNVHACMVNPSATTLAGPVSQSYNEFNSTADVMAALVASSSIPCGTMPTFYSLFRGAPFVDGGYCTPPASLCPDGDDTCVRISSTVVGDNLRGTAAPTAQSE